MTGYNTYDEYHVVFAFIKQLVSAVGTLHPINSVHALFARRYPRWEDYLTNNLVSSSVIIMSGTNTIQ